QGQVQPANVISGNAGFGIEIHGGDDNKIRGNYIGTSVDGMSKDDGANNVGNTGGGIQIRDLLKTAAGNIIGGDTLNQGNVISNNGGHGVEITGAGQTQNFVRRNNIGTNAARSKKAVDALPNTGDGVRVTNGARNTVIDLNQIGFNTGKGTNCT